MYMLLIINQIFYLLFLKHVDIVYFLYGVTFVAVVESSDISTSSSIETITVDHDGVIHKLPNTSQQQQNILTYNDNTNIMMQKHMISILDKMYDYLRENIPTGRCR